MQGLERRGVQAAALGRGDAPPQEAFDAVIDANGDSRRFRANQNPHESFVANVLSVSERLAAIDAGTYVYLSTIDVYGEKRGERKGSREDAAIDLSGLETYGLHKRLAELLVLHQAERPLVARLGTVIGPGLKKNPVYDALNGLPIRQTPESTLSLIELATVEDALWRLLDGGTTGIVNVTCARSITVARVLEMAAEATGRMDHDFHQDLLTTSYDINVDRMAAMAPLPTAEEMLAAYLGRIERGQGS